MLKKVVYVTVPVSDQDKALEFWTKKIGLTIATDQPHVKVAWRISRRKEDPR